MGRSAITYEDRQRWGLRVDSKGYYTDGARLYEVQAIGANGCVVVRDSSSERIKCVSIEGFRERYWLVKGSG